MGHGGNDATLPYALAGIADRGSIGEPGVRVAKGVLYGGDCGRVLSGHIFSTASSPEAQMRPQVVSGMLCCLAHNGGAMGLNGAQDEVVVLIERKCATADGGAD